MPLKLKNPHSILAALEQRPQDVIELRLPTKGGTDAWDAVRELAEAQRIPLKHGRPEQRNEHPRRGRREQPEKTGREGAGEALVRELPGVALGDLFADAGQRAAGHGLWLALDCIQDPHNVGAIIRTAAFFGVQGLLMTADRAAPLSGTVYDVAAGGLEHVPFSIQINLARSLELAKEAGLWTLGSSEHAEEDVSQVPRDRPWLLVVGNEAKGLRRLTLERCDQVCRITPRGAVGSLNASVAAAILIANLA
jgi:23S rRNA (guanosine2251-2'-O)-methyltransferase